MKLLRIALGLVLLAVVDRPPVLLAQAGKTAEKSLDWNQFRGPNRDAHSPETGLLKEWPSSGPTLAWKASGLGVGFSSVSVSANHVFTMGEIDNKCNLVALNASDGKLFWKLPMGAPSRTPKEVRARVPLRRPMECWSLALGPPASWFARARQTEE